MSARPTVLLFDIDGTLLTCGGAGRTAMERAFLERVPEVSTPPVFRFAGGTDLGIARQYLVQAGREPTLDAMQALLDAYLRHLPTSLAEASTFRVLEGAVALLDRLEGRGYAIGLGTGNHERGAYTKLAHGGLDARFSFGGFGSDAEDRAELIRMGAERGAAKLGHARTECRVVVIGDTERDIAAAKAIGAESVGVTTGPIDGTTLANAGADHVFDGLHAAGVDDALTHDPR